jgi:hypothetical protein
MNAIPARQQRRPRTSPRNEVTPASALITSIFLVFMSTGLVAQTAAQVFTSAAGEFRLTLATPLVRCARDPNASTNGGTWLPVSWCRPDVCEDQALPPDSTMVCIAYNGSEFAGKVAFGAGALFVARVRKAGSETVCLQAESEWSVPSWRKAKIADQPSVRFRTVERWMMHERQSVIYRVFHAGTCYEIGIQRVHNSTAPYDPGTYKMFTPQDEARVQVRLRDALQSFRFTN